MPKLPSGVIDFFYYSKYYFFIGLCEFFFIFFSSNFRGLLFISPRSSLIFFVSDNAASAFKYRIFKDEGKNF